MRDFSKRVPKTHLEKRSDLVAEFAASGLDSTMTLVDFHRKKVNEARKARMEKKFVRTSTPEE